MTALRKFYCPWGCLYLTRYKSFIGNHSKECSTALLISVQDLYTNTTPNILYKFERARLSIFGIFQQRTAPYSQYGRPTVRVGRRSGEEVEGPVTNWDAFFHLSTFHKLFASRFPFQIGDQQLILSLFWISSPTRW
jgi:hypothetical protein